MKKCCETHGTNFCPECGENLTGIHTLATLLVHCKGQAHELRSWVKNVTGDPNQSQIILKKKDIEKWDAWCELLLPMISYGTLDRWLAFKRDLSVRSTKTMVRLNINSFDALCKHTGTDLRGAKCCGEVTVAEITSLLQEYNLSLKGESE